MKWFLFTYGIFVMVTLLAESVVTIIVNGRNSELKKRTSTIFINNLAICGVVIGIFIGLYTMSRAFLFNQDSPWCHPELHIFFWTLSYLHLVSILCLVCLSFDRYLAICWPLRYRVLLTGYRCRLMVAICWILPALFLVLPTVSVFVHRLSIKSPLNTRYRIVSNEQFSQDSCMDNLSKDETVKLETWLAVRQTSNLSYVTVYFLSCFIIACTYSLVLKELCTSGQRKHATNSMKEEDIRVRKKTAKDFFLVILMYVTLSMPHVMLKICSVDWKTNLMKYSITIILATFHQILFLPMYAWRFEEFRGEIRRSLRGAFRVIRPRVHPHPDSSPSPPPLSPAGHEDLKESPSAASATSATSMASTASSLTSVV